MLVYTGNKHKEEKLNKLLGLERGGDPKIPLPNMRRSDQSEFWGHHSFMGNNWLQAYIGCQQMEDVNGKKRWATLHIFFDDTMSYRSAGFLVATYHSEYVGKYPDGNYVHDVEYFFWTACVHDWKEKNIGNCLHRYSCTKCPDTYDVDSSG